MLSIEIEKATDTTLRLQEKARRIEGIVMNE